MIQAFRAAANRLKITLAVHGADASPLAPAMHHVDQRHRVSPVASNRYINDLCAVVRRHKIDLLIPLIDDELPAIADAAPRFQDLGCTALISSPAVIATCRDKLATFAVLKKAGVDTPNTWSFERCVAKSRHRFPYFLKPRFGSAAMGNYVVKNETELQFFGNRVSQPIVQEFVDGVEHTLDVYTGMDGRPRCVVPRRRIEVRSGEVSKGIIAKDAAVMAVGRHVAEALEGCRGVVTVQCIVTPRGRIRVIEINPRFGGGAPLAIRAGADFPRWIIMQRVGKTPRINPLGFHGDMAMLRYDQSVFIAGAAKYIPQPKAR